MTTYYLDSAAADASDKNAGTSSSAPFASLAALDRVLQPGDTVLIASGTSYKGGLTIASSGTSAAPITFGKYGSGADPVINATGQAGINITGSYVTINGIDVTGGTYGVQLTNASHDLMENMQVSGAGEGFSITGGGSDNFEGNYVHDLKMVLDTPGGNDDYGAVAFVMSETSNDDLGYNKIVNAQASSDDYGTDGGGFEVWKSVSNITIHDNLVQNSDGFFEVGGQGASDVASNIQVYDNVSANSGDFAWLHNDTSQTFGMKITGLDMSNNTIYSPATYQIVGADVPITPGTVNFTGNAVYAPASNIVLASGVTHSNNFYQASVPPTGSGELNGTIDFTSVSANDFAIVSNTSANGYGAYTDGATPGVYSPPTSTTGSGTSTGTGTGSGGSSTTTTSHSRGGGWHDIGHSFHGH